MQWPLNNIYRLWIKPRWTMRELDQRIKTWAMILNMCQRWWSRGDWGVIQSVTKTSCSATQFLLMKKQNIFVLLAQEYGEVFAAASLGQWFWQPTQDFQGVKGETESELSWLLTTAAAVTCWSQGVEGTSLHPPPPFWEQVCSKAIVGDGSFYSLKARNCCITVLMEVALLLQCSTISEQFSGLGFIWKYVILDQEGFVLGCHILCPRLHDLCCSQKHKSPHYLDGLGAHLWHI